MTAWLEALRHACENSSQRQIATLLRQGNGFPSPSIVNQALSEKYPSESGLQRLEALVNKHIINSDWREALRQEGKRTEWIAALQVECEKTSQAKVAKALRQVDGFPSPTVINQVLHDTYPSDRGRERLQMLVEGRYMGVTLDCPVIGDIGLDVCAEWQALPFSAANSLRVEMFRACLKCPNRRNHDDSDN